MCFEIKLDSPLSLYAHAMNTAKGKNSRFSIIYKLSRIHSNPNRTFSIRFDLWCVHTSNQANKQLISAELFSPRKRIDMLMCNVRSRKNSSLKPRSVIKSMLDFDLFLFLWQSV